MRIKLLSPKQKEQIKREQRYKKFNEKKKKMINWHEYYSWLPTRISSDEVIFLEKIYRRATEVFDHGKDGYPKLSKVTWEYKSVFDFLRDEEDKKKK